MVPTVLPKTIRAQPLFDCALGKPTEHGEGEVGGRCSPSTPVIYRFRAVGGSAPQRKSPASAGGLIDCRIHLDCHRTHSSESDLKNQYDALASPIPPHLTALVKRLGMQQ